MNEEHNLYGLVYECPYLQRHADCPFRQVDHLIFKEKVRWVNELSEEEKGAYLEHHKVCSANR